MMPAPQVPNESQWYYAAELRKMLDVLRNENRNVKESKELKTNSERIAEIKRFVSPFPTLDEAQAKFGAEIKGRHVPRDRAALLPPPPQEPEPVPAPPVSVSGPPPVVPPAVFRLTGRRRGQGDALQYQVDSGSGSLWVLASGLPALGLSAPPPPSAPVAPVNNVVQESARGTGIAVISVRDNMVTLKRSDGRLAVLPIESATRRHPELVARFLLARNTPVVVKDVKVGVDGKVVYLVGEEWKSADLLPASSVQDFLQKRALTSVPSAPDAKECSVERKYELMTFPYSVSGTQHHLFSATFAFDPRAQWQLWPSKFRKAYHTKSAMVLAAWSRVHVLQGSLSIKPPKLDKGLRVEMSSKDIAWSGIAKVEATSELPTPVFWTLLKRRNIMDLHCYYQWRGDWVQDIVEFETRLHSLEVVCGMSSVAKAYDLIMMYRAELGVDTKYVELFQRATMRQPQIFFPPAEYDDHLPDWQLQRKRKQPEKTPNPKTKSPENCKFFLQGSCRYGNRCNKLHDRDLKGVLRKRPSDDANDGRRQRKKGNGRS